jgi:hypothetical protein
MIECHVIYSTAILYIVAPYKRLGETPKSVLNANEIIELRSLSNI